MRESKRRKLESKGWKLGNAKDLLGLSNQEEMYIELRLKLAEGLKARRRATGVTQVNLAKTLKSSQSRVAKMEAGDPTVSLDLLVKSILALGASNRDLAAIIAKSERRQLTMRLSDAGLRRRQTKALLSRSSTPSSAHRRRARDRRNRLLGGDLYILDMARRRGNRSAVLTQPVQVKSDGLANRLFSGG